jgi:hypothetical protein
MTQEAGDSGQQFGLQHSHHVGMQPGGTVGLERPSVALVLFVF